MLPQNKLNNILSLKQQFINYDNKTHTFYLFKETIFSL